VSLPNTHLAHAALCDSMDLYADHHQGWFMDLDWALRYILAKFIYETLAIVQRVPLYRPIPPGILLLIIIIITPALSFASTF
jgi:hypothetical protein